jgi:5-methylthioadenosine/S-adenosylhomocysteine deaminase
MSTEELLGLYQYLLDKWHNTAGGRVRAGVSISAPQRVKIDYFGALSELSKKYDIPFNMHILETKLQRVLGETKYGKSLVHYVDDLGFLDKRSVVIHAIWVDDRDVELMAAAGCSIAHNPVCNLRLGSGVMTFRRHSNAGINICLGSDEACTDDTRMDDQVGVLAPGYEADLILVDLNTLSFTPLNDIYRQLIYCETGSSVEMTMVAGEIVYKDGKLLTIDEEEIKAEAREIMKSYRKDMEKTWEAARQLEPYYREMYQRCTKTEVGMNRWVQDSPVK